MSWQRSSSTLKEMIEALKASGFLNDSRVEAAMLKVDRSCYCTSKYPYNDYPDGIGYGATISAPHMHAKALDVLADKLVDGAKVLDVGSGSGYLTSCIAHMIGPKGTVYGIDHVKELVQQSESNIKRDCDDLLISGRIKLLERDGRLGLPEYAPYDAIHVGATAPELPTKLIDQLKVGGMMVVPVQHGEDQVFEKIEKQADGQIERKHILKVRYVPLTDVQSQLKQS